MNILFFILLCQMAVQCFEPCTYFQVSSVCPLALYIGVVRINEGPVSPEFKTLNRRSMFDGVLLIHLIFHWRFIFPFRTINPQNRMLLILFNQSFIFVLIFKPMTDHIDNWYWCDYQIIPKQITLRWK